MEVPSGRVLDALDLKTVQLMAQYGFIHWSDGLIRFNSGVESHVYVGGRDDLTEHPDLLRFLGLKVAQWVLENTHDCKDQKQQCLIGIPTVGTTLAQAAAMVDFVRWRNISLDAAEKPRITYRVMREERKSHGVHQTWVDGTPDPARQTYWMLDNTVTDGGTKMETRERLREDGYPVRDMPTLILVDRQQRGIELMRQAGFSSIEVVYYLLDLTYAFGEMNLWPRDRVQAVEQEIRVHQLVW